MPVAAAAAPTITGPLPPIGIDNRIYRGISIAVRELVG